MLSAITRTDLSHCFVQYYYCIVNEKRKKKKQSSISNVNCWQRLQIQQPPGRFFFAVIIGTRENMCKSKRGFLRDFVDELTEKKI